MLFFITIGIAILALVFAVILDDEYDWRSGLCVLCTIISVLAWVTAVVMAVLIAVNNLGVQGTIASNEQRRESLVYQLENNLYDNDNDLGKKELYDQIQKWNEDLADGKALQYDFWVGIFYPNIYDQFEFIELEKE